MVDRPIIQVGELPCAEDVLGGWKDTLYGIGYLALATIGPNTGVNGFALSPTVPASLSVNVGVGSIYSTETVDATAYGVLGTDSNSVVKQGLLESPVTVTLTAPTTSGFSQVYIIQVAYDDVDTGTTLVPFFNSADPSSPSSSTENTIRQGQAVVELKAGTAASTGSQTQPAPDAGFTALWAITLANGATTVTSANWVQLSSNGGPFGAPWFPNLESLTSGAANSPGLQNVRKFTTIGTTAYTPTAGARALEIVVQAPGGGGASSNAPGSGGIGAGTPGSGGGYTTKYVLTSGLTFPATITIGAPGTGATAGGNPGGAGGATSFVCTGMTSIVCGGGNGGVFTPASSFPTNSAGAVGGTASGGDININGGWAQAVLYFTSTQALGGLSGGTPLGQPAGQFAINGPGTSGSGFGSGGGGALSYFGASAFAGAAGQPGIVIITELF